MTSPVATTAGVADGLARVEPRTPGSEDLVHGASERRLAVTTAPVAVNRGPSESPTPLRVPAGAIAAAPSRSPLGLIPVPAPLAIRLDGPRQRETNRETETVSGRITGGPLARLVLHVNGTAREVEADRGPFQVSVSLQPGLNHLRAVATDSRGVEAEDAITVEYVLPPARYGIKITSPMDGYRVPPDAPPFVVVEGEVEDREASSVWLFANTRRVAVRATQGRFRQILPLFDPVVSLWAQTPVNGGSTYRSQPLLVGVAAPTPSVGVLVMDWGVAAAGAEVEISALRRARPDRATAPEESVPLQAFKASPNPGPSDVFYFRNPKPGVYTVVLRTRSPERVGNVRPTLYLTEGGVLRAVDLRPVSLDGTGVTVLAKILLPQGVLWEQDDWFTGQSESVDTVTKFRLPEAITWTERKSVAR